MEADAPATFYDVHKICKSLRISAAKLDLIFDEIKKEWKIKNPLAKVKRVKTDTKGLIMFWVIEEKENKI